MIDRKKYTIDKETGCWNFKGCKTKAGYGRIRVNGVHWMAHRYALSQFLGRPLGDGLVVLHKCDNPACVNPEHLREGTQKENIQDCINKGRAKKATGPRSAKPKKTRAEELREIVVRRHRAGWTATAIAKYHKLSLKWVKDRITEYVSA